MEKESHNKDISRTDEENLSQKKNFRINSISKNEFEKKDKIWDVISSQIRKDIGETAWRSWIKPLEFGDLKDGVIHLSASSKLVCDRVKSHYSDKLRLIAKSLSLPVSALEINWNELSSLMNISDAPSGGAPRITEMKDKELNRKAVFSTHGLDPRFTTSFFRDFTRWNSDIIR